MAHRIISQVVFTGARVVGKAFAEAYKQAASSQRHAAANGSGGSGSLGSSRLTLVEACKILDVAPPKDKTPFNIDAVHSKFKRLYDLNDPKKGGSFYLQSKVLRARERIEMEVREAAQDAEERAWRPRLYRN
ncbi:mitochondrial import inner membrane translocase subunit tim16 [Piedraia hortae CBS 480.64]|uniref:Mitochondrial import inner membrane translocase subunit TIM16 n=1 Tax=Piedraia hortae CBS 480.64 TaxID=1314780 RepID=A0A6A7C9E5_9PEZI|nr:mitochondrial import inner membrane translocase subunit tim16 [Piedraia hortae CBS 480.64]